MKPLLHTLILLGLCSLARPISAEHLKQATVEEDFVQPVTPADLRLGLLDDGDYLDAYTYILLEEDGSVLFVQTIVTSLGLSSQQPALEIKYFDPKGQRTFYAKEYDREDLRLGKEGDPSFGFGGNRMEYDAEKRSIRFSSAGEEGQTVSMDLNFAPDGDGFKVGDGKVYFNGEKEDFYYVAYPMPRAKIEGWLEVDGTRKEVSGTGFVSHVMQSIKPHHIANTWYLTKLHGADWTLNLHSFTAPSDHNGEKMLHGSFLYRGELVAVTLDNAVVPIDPALDPETDYAYPQRLRFEWNGQTLDGRPFKAQSEFAPSNVIDKFDVLGHLPWILRIIIKAFVARPYYYQSYQPVSATVWLGEERLELKGKVFNEVIYVNEED